MKIDEKLSTIQVEFKAHKSKFNSFGKYNYRSAEDILEALKPFNEKYKVHFTINEHFIDSSNGPVIVSIAKITDSVSGNFVEAKGIAGVEKAGGMQLPQAYGSASSYAKKYSLGNLLLIDDTQDADTMAPQKKQAKASTTKPPANNEFGF